MNPDTHPESSTHQLSETAPEIARETSDATDAVADTIHESTKRTTADAACDMYHSASLKAERSLATSKEFVRRNPVPAVLGALVFGATAGCLLMMARRKPTFGERYADEPLDAVREAIGATFAPMTQRVHQGYDSARSGAEKAAHRLHRFGTGRKSASLTHRLGRISNNLKFW